MGKGHGVWWGEENQGSQIPFLEMVNDGSKFKTVVFFFKLLNQHPKLQTGFSIRAIVVQEAAKAQLSNTSQEYQDTIPRHLSTSLTSGRRKVDMGLGVPKQWGWYPYTASG